MASSERLRQRQDRWVRVLAPPAPASAAAYDQAIRERYSDLADEYLRLYPTPTRRSLPPNLACP